MNVAWLLLASVSLCSPVQQRFHAYISSTAAKEEVSSTVLMAFIDAGLDVLSEPRLVTSMVQAEDSTVFDYEMLASLGAVFTSRELCLELMKPEIDFPRAHFIISRVRDIPECDASRGRLFLLVSNAHSDDPVCLCHIFRALIAHGWSCTEAVRYASLYDDSELLVELIVNQGFVLHEIVIASSFLTVSSLRVLSEAGLDARLCAVYATGIMAVELELFLGGRRAEDLFEFARDMERLLALGATVHMARPQLKTLNQDASFFDIITSLL